MMPLVTFNYHSTKMDGAKFAHSYLRHFLGVAVFSWTDQVYQPVTDIDYRVSTA